MIPSKPAVQGAGQWPLPFLIQSLSSPMIEISRLTGLRPHALANTAETPGLVMHAVRILEPAETFAPVQPLVAKLPVPLHLSVSG